ncbi:hypothetical protein LSCM1_07850 [Leishmania martiniquensis]|uniref:Uncharacterized protein n=1 Tax=Leishmania martiniquensis TaxID=1580590 RepID=A0A836HX52_9TRYP|nr:hypothetical protein LSCM1_07850 [Leishmania martiniquensis]
MRSVSDKNPLMVTHKGIRGSGIVDAVAASLRKNTEISGVTAFDDVQANPTRTSASGGLRMLNIRDFFFELLSRVACRSPLVALHLHEF